MLPVMLSGYPLKEVILGVNGSVSSSSRCVLVVREYRKASHRVNLLNLQNVITRRQFYQITLKRRDKVINNNNDDDDYDYDDSNDDDNDNNHNNNNNNKRNYTPLREE